VAVPVADTVIEYVPGGVAGMGVGVGVGGGGEPPLPPQLMSPITRSMADTPRTVARLVLRELKPSSTIPTVNNPAPHAAAFRRFSCLGDNSNAFGPEVLMTTVAETSSRVPPTETCAGRIVQVVSGGRAPQLNATFPVKPLRDSVPIENTPVCPARIVSEFGTGFTA